MAGVLIVEDEELLSNAFKLILEKDGHEVKTASNGLEAIEILNNFAPGLILLDLLMPKMGGLEFLEKYQKPLKKAKQIIVVLSNLQNQQNVDRAKELGAQQHLVKSQVTPTELSKLVYNLLKIKKTTA